MRRASPIRPGSSDLRAALALSLEQQNTREAYTVYSNLAGSLAIVQPAAALEAADEGIAYAKARGLAPGVQAMRQWALLRLGRWDEVLEAGQEVLSIAEALGDRWVTTHVAATMALVLARRGAPDEAVDLARRFSDESTQEPFFVPLVVAHRTAGRLEDAERRLEKVVQRWMEENGVPGWDFDLSDLAREAIALSRSDLLERLLTLTEGGGRATLLSGRHGRRSQPRPPDVMTTRSLSFESPSWAGGSAQIHTSRRTRSSDRHAASSPSGVRKTRWGRCAKPAISSRDLGAVLALAETRALLGEGETAAYVPPSKRTASCPGLLSSGVEMEIDAADPPARHPNHPRRQSCSDRVCRHLHPVRPRPEPDGVAAPARRLHRVHHPAGTGEAEQDPARRFLAGIGPTDGRRSEHQPAKAGDPRCCCARTAEREHRRRECDRTDDCQAHDLVIYRRSGRTCAEGA